MLAISIKISCSKLQNNRCLRYFAWSCAAKSTGVTVCMHHMCLLGWNTELLYLSPWALPWNSTTDNCTVCYTKVCLLCSQLATKCFSAHCSAANDCALGLQGRYGGWEAHLGVCAMHEVNSGLLLNTAADVSCMAWSEKHLPMNVTERFLHLNTYQAITIVGQLYTWQVFRHDMTITRIHPCNLFYISQLLGLEILWWFCTPDLMVNVKTQEDRT